VAIAFVQQTTAAAKSVTALAFPAITAAAGNALFVLVGVKSATVSISSITDNLGNTWTQVALRTGTSTREYIYYALNVAGGSTTVTVNFSASVTAAQNLSEFSGIATSSALDVAGAGAQADASTSPATGSVTTANANDLVIGGAGQVSVETVLTGPSNSFAGLSKANTTGGSGASNITQLSAYRIVTATGTFSTAWTVNNAQDWAGIMRRSRRRALR